MASWFRIVYSAVLAVTVSQLVAALGAVGEGAAPSNVLQKAEAFTDIWNMGLVAFGVQSRVGWLPRLPLGIQAQVARSRDGDRGFGYLFDAATRAVIEDPVFSLSVITGLGEFVLGVWLVSRPPHLSAVAGGSRR